MAATAAAAAAAVAAAAESNKMTMTPRLRQYPSKVSICAQAKQSNIYNYLLVRKIIKMLGVCL